MNKRFVPFMCTLLALAPGLWPVALHAEEVSQQEAVPLEELRVFAEIFGRIKSDYVDPVDDQTLLRYAIRGMLSGLDPHSAYLDEEEYEDLKVGTSGEFGGLGIEVGTEDGFIKVISPIDDTPAQRAGIKAGDLIIRIDGQQVKGMHLDEAVSLMRGKPGTKIVLSIAREGVDKPLEITITRAIIKVVSVRHRELAPGLGYLRISQFQARTAGDVLKAVAKLKEESADGLKGLVLDLRNNPGGVLNAAVAVGDAFLREGLVVYTEGRVNDASMKFQAAPDDVLDGAPMVVLVNEGSASAAEIVAGALQDHQRAVIMGRTTFGKGSVQSVLPVNERVGLKLTTARYFTPNGRSIQAEGIVPDIVLQPLSLAEKAADELHLKEADLSGHLENPNGGNGARPEDGAKKGKPLALTDYELYEAMNLLKGLVILQQGAR